MFCIDCSEGTGKKNLLVSNGREGFKLSYLPIRLCFRNAFLIRLNIPLPEDKWCCCHGNLKADALPLLVGWCHLGHTGHCRTQAWERQVIWILGDMEDLADCTERLAILGGRVWGADKGSRDPKTGPTERCHPFHWQLTGQTERIHGSDYIRARLTF